MHRGLGIDGRIERDDEGVITAPSTDEVFLRETMKYYKQLMKAEPRLVIERDVGAA